jgi:peptide-methionine (S)-S-oxide reductase
VISLKAERLSDTAQLGANVWLTPKGPILRPCEVPAEEVLQFLRAAADANAR